MVTSLISSHFSIKIANEWMKCYELPFLRAILITPFILKSNYDIRVMFVYNLFVLPFTW
jgi:hypothetical protein